MDIEYKEIPFEIDVKGITEEGEFSGYGSTFGGKADSYGDVIAEGAYAGTILKNGYGGLGVKMLWQHNSTDPIGKYLSLQENKTGLKVHGKLTKGVQRADEAHLLMKDGVVNSLSIGFSLPDKESSEFNPKTGIRNLKRIDLHEISLVTFPANTRATITNVKSIEDAKTERELEHALRESGLSKQVSMMVVKMCKPYLREIKAPTTDNSDGISQILAALKNKNAENEIIKALTFN